MAAKETVIGKFVNQILFKVDKSSVDDAKSAISEVKGFAAKALGAIGIGFSFTKLASLAEEFGSINDTIRGATREMGDQADIQQKILKGAQDCREEYGVMAGDVTKLVQLNSKLFPVDDAVKGSPPRMRRKVAYVLDFFQHVGITPAYAGKRDYADGWVLKGEDHPRMCGEK